MICEIKELFHLKLYAERLIVKYAEKTFRKEQTIGDKFGERGDNLDRQADRQTK